MFIDDLSWRFSSTWSWMFSGFCCLAVRAKDINQFISFSKATVFSAEFRHGYLRLVLVLSPLFFSLSITLDLNFRRESINILLVLFHSSLVISTLLVLLTVSELQLNLSLLLLSLVTSVSSCCYFAFCILFLFNNVPILEPISAYISAYSQTLKHWLKQKLLDETSTLSPQNP